MNFMLVYFRKQICSCRKRFYGLSLNFRLSAYNYTRLQFVLNSRLLVFMLSLHKALVSCTADHG